MPVVDAIGVVEVSTQDDPNGQPFENVPVQDIVVNDAFVRP
jgi:hypothetical protein